MADFPLPPGFTAAKMSQARKAFEAALGADKVFFEDLDRTGYQDKFAIDDARHHPAGAIAPTSVEEVQAAVKIANQFRVPLWPISRGKNLGYGTSAPELAGSVVLDLSRMKKIEFDAANGVVTLEPGVGFYDLYDYLQQHSLFSPRLGITLQSGGVYPWATAGEILELFAGFAARPLDTAMLIDRLGLRKVVRTRFRRLSGGEQQRLALAVALVGRPELVFLDEPTAGMDTEARHMTWRLISELRADGVSVLLTTHLLDEAERLADHVVIMNSGVVAATGTPAELTAAAGIDLLEVRADAGLATVPRLGVGL